GGATHRAEDRVLSAVRRQHLLLILDNCEHVIEAAAALVARLLREAEGVTVLATSREQLGLAGETVWEVPPLDRAAAAELFAVRAAAHSRTFRLGPHHAPMIDQLVTRLDGLPLALELAATRVRALGVTGVVERLDDRFRLLTTRQRDRPERQRTLTAVIEWSWDLLDDAERTVLSRLAVFRGGCTPAAAEAVCEADLDVLARLVDRSLLVVDSAGEPRYRLLESIAAFALDRLAEPEATRRRHLTYFTELAERADPELRGPAQREWLTRLDAEDGNLRAALDHASRDSEGREHSERLAKALAWYWFLRGRFTEARAALPEGSSWWAGFALRQGLTVAPPPETDPRARWFVASGLLERSELTTAAAMLEEILESCDTWTEAAALSSRAMLAHAASDLAALERDSTRSAKLFAELGDRWGRLQAADWLGGLADIRGEYDRAAAMHREGLRWAEELSLWTEVGGKLGWLAWLAIRIGDYVQARELGERSLRLAEEQDNATAAIFARLCIGFAARRDGKLDLAVSVLRGLADSDDPSPLWLPMVLTELGYATGSRADHLRAFDIAWDGTFTRDASAALVGIASLAPPEVAAKLLGAAGEVEGDDDLRRVTAQVRSALGDRFDDLYAEGRALPLPEARALVA
ncbi:MAG: transcriptional regulator, partial [Actinoplanes sp.]